MATNIYPIRPAAGIAEGDVLPKRIAIIGLGPSANGYLYLSRKHGGRRAIADEVWGINALGDVLLCDRIFHMDDVRIQEIRAAAKPDSNIAAMLQWMKGHPGPIYTSRPREDYPGMVALPIEDMIRTLKFVYFNSTAAWAVAYAVYLNIVTQGAAAKELSIFGMDFTYPNVHDAEKGRACVEFWLGVASARGVKVVAPRSSSLLDSCHTEAERLYGFDTLEVKIENSPEGLKFGYTEREKLPTAEEIERSYDHTRHPNPLMLEEKVA